MSKASVSATALLVVAGGAWLTYAGIRDVPVVEGLRDVLGGDLPPGTAQPLRFAKSGGTVDKGVGEPTGNMVDVPAPGGGTTRVDSSLAPNLRALYDAAAAAGIRLAGGGYRSSARQAALRLTNGCGNLYGPSSRCRVPTAPVGKSMHEKGLAVDFTHNGSTIRRGSAADRWLLANAGTYGMKNLPSEAWHYSTTGS